LFVTVLRCMMHGRCKPLHLIVYGLAAHRMRLVCDYVDNRDSKLTRLLGYASNRRSQNLVSHDVRELGSRPVVPDARL